MNVAVEIDVASDTTDARGELLRDSKPNIESLPSEPTKLSDVYPELLESLKSGSARD